MQVVATPLSFDFKSVHTIEANPLSYASYSEILAILKDLSLKPLSDFYLLFKSLYLPKPHHVQNKLYQENFAISKFKRVSNTGVLLRILQNF